jgi:mono/diheme cytochrome c family protein
MKKVTPFIIVSLFVSSLFITHIANANDHATATSDTRQSIVMTETERNLVLIEMRGFLQSVQVIVEALGKDDAVAVAKAATKVGMIEQKPMPAELKKKLPKEFKMLGMKTHKAFDQLALDAKDMEDKQQTLEQLGRLMKNCVSCHAMFKLDTKK